MFLSLYVLLGAGVIIALLFLWNIRLEWKLRRLCAGKRGSLDDVIAALKDKQDALEEFRKDAEGYLKHVERRLRGAVRGVSTVRFNPFRGDGSGGNQSFATAFLDEEGNGVVFSSLYARDRMSMFAKPLEKHSCPFELTEEEKKACAEAVQRSKS